MLTTYINKKPFYGLLLLCICFVIACKKKEIPLETNTPIFFFDGTIAGNAVLIEAGKNNQYMHTNFVKDSNGLYTFTGKFAPTNCDTCEPSLSVDINANVRINSQIIADVSALANQTIFNSYSLDSIGTNTTIYAVQCNAKNNASVTSYLWNFGDGTTSTLPNPLHNYATTGIKNIKLVTNSPFGKDSIVQSIYLNSNNNLDPLQVDSLDTTNRHLVIRATKINYNKYLWDFGDGSTDTNIITNHTFANLGIHNVTLTSTSNTDTNVSRIRIYFSPFQPNILPNFETTKTTNTITQYSQRVNLTACVITYKQNGKVYKSYKTDASTNQSNTPIFKLLSFNQYLPNTKGQKTIQLNGDAETYLYNVANNMDSLKLKSNKLSFAVAIP